MKFRAWSKKHNKYLKITGIQYDGDKIAGVFVVYGTIAGIPNIIFLEAEDVVLEQYTGLKDKNGKEIYVGDIVRAEDNGRYLVGAVEWNEDYAKCEVIYDQITGNSFEFEGDSGYPVANSCEVIGNIHENPELLEER